MREAKNLDIALLILLGIIWGSSFFNIKIASVSYEPFTLVLLRVIFASIPLIDACLVAIAMDRSRFRRVLLGFITHYVPVDVSN